MFRRLITGSIFFIALILTTTAVNAESTVTGYLFYGEGCPHCKKERAYLQETQNRLSYFEVKEFEIYYDQQNNQLLQKVSAELDTQVGGVPFLVIGDDYFIGFSEEFTPIEIENKIKACAELGCEDVVKPFLSNATEESELGERASESPPPDSPAESIQDGTRSADLPTETTEDPLAANNVRETDDGTPSGIAQEPQTFQVPLLGYVDLSTMSLPLITIVLAFLDGFNPCAMWTLLFLISLLLGMKDRKRMWSLGIAFIVTSAGVYFLFLSAWLNLFLFLGMAIWMRSLIGLIALAAGYYYLRDFWKNRSGGCNVMGDTKRQKVFEKLKAITQKRRFAFALVGIILLAIAVNMVELVCSAGLPAIYTQILSLSDLPTWQYYFYLGLYILIFMLDDLFVFFTAMITLKAVGVESKYARYSHLIGGVLMLVIGLLLLFKPEWLMFG